MTPLRSSSSSTPTAHASSAGHAETAPLAAPTPIPAPIPTPIPTPITESNDADADTIESDAPTESELAAAVMVDESPPAREADAAAAAEASPACTRELSISDKPHHPATPPASNVATGRTWRARRDAETNMSTKSRGIGFITDSKTSIAQLRRWTIAWAARGTSVTHGVASTDRLLGEGGAAKQLWRAHPSGYLRERARPRTRSNQLVRKESSATQPSVQEHSGLARQNPHPPAPKAAYGLVPPRVRASGAVESYRVGTVCILRREQLQEQL